MLMELVFSTYKKDLVIFLSEHEHKNLSQIAKMADRYSMAHLNNNKEVKYSECHMPTGSRGIIVTS